MRLEPGMLIIGHDSQEGAVWRVVARRGADMWNCECLQGASKGMLFIFSESGEWLPKYEAIDPFESWVWEVRQDALSEL